MAYKRNIEIFEEAYTKLDSNSTISYEARDGQRRYVKGAKTPSGSDDKPYEPSKFSGLGRKNLEKNIVSNKNVLTQAMVADASTVYHIQYDYDLDGATITLPAGVTLKFEGGKISNGTITGSQSEIKGNIDVSSLSLAGTWKNTSFSLYDIGCVPDDTSAATSNTAKITAFISILQVIKKDLIVPKGNWYFNSPLVMDGSFSLLCEGYLVYLCTSSNVNNTALTIGKTSANFTKEQRVKIYQTVSGYTFSADTIPDNVGVRFINPYYAKLDIPYARSFAYCVVVEGNSIGCAYNTITMDSIGWGQCYTAFSLIALNSGWANENLILSANVHKESNDIYGDSMIGIRVAGGSHSANNNIFIKPCVEGCAVGIKLENATNNVFYDVRNELTTTTVVSDSSCQGNITYPYQSRPAYFGLSNVRIYKDDLANCTLRQVFIAPTSYVRWLTSGSYYISGIHLDAATYSYENIGSSIKSYGTNHYLGHILDVSNVRGFCLKAQDASRFVIRCFDSNGDVITTNAFEEGSGAFMLGQDNKTYVTQTNLNAISFRFANEVKTAFIGAFPAAKILNVSAYCANSDELPAILSEDSGKINVAAPTDTVNANIGDRIYNQKTKTFNLWNGEKWCDSDGMLAGKMRVGGTDRRPTLHAHEYGLRYFDYDLSKEIYAGTKSVLINNKALSYKGAANDKYFYSMPAVGDYLVKHSSTHNGTISVWLATTNDISTATKVKLGELYKEQFLPIEITSEITQNYSYILFQNEAGNGSYFYMYTLDMSAWVESDGATAGVARSGDTASRPASADIYVGFQYWDTDLGKMIAWDGSAWVNLDGSALS